MKAGAGGFFEPVPRAGMSGIQFKMNVGQPGDKFEQEADRMADKVMRMPASASPVKEEKLQRQADDTLQKKEDEKIQKAPAAEEKLQRKGDGTPTINAGTQSAIQNSSSGGQPLAPDVRSYMEPRFGADFSKVRIHSDPEAASLSNQLSARAFTHQNHVFFSRDQYQPGTSEGKQLLAHELTHTIQQGHAVQRSPQVSTTTTPPPVQRLGIQDALDYFADKANNIPGFRMLTILMGFNPISMRSVARTAANLLRALIELMPGGNFITQALDNHGVINKAAAWVEQKIAILGDIGGEIVNGLKRFIDSLGWRDLFRLGSVWNRAKAIFTTPLTRLISFGTSVAVEILKMVKDAILKPLAALAQGTRGYDLLKAILGEDPITGQAVPRTAETLLGGFMKFIGQDEIWGNIKKGNAIARAWAWFQGALSGLMGLVRAVPRKIVATFSSLTFMDIITVVGVFGKIVGAFANIAIDFISWGLSTTWSLLEIIFDVVKPGIMVYIKKTGAALKSIIKNPLPFVGNLVRAAKTGFQNFADNFGGHLKAGLIDWLTGSLSGVYIPKALSLPEMGKFAMSVLGITWAQIRGKIVKVLGPNGETIMKGLETGFDIVVALVTGGPAAAWELIKGKLTDLKDQVVSGIIGFVTNTVITKAVPKLISMFIPGAGFISAIISIYDTVMVFVEKISKIIQVVVAFIDSIVTIAAGNITAAAKRVESILGGLLSLAISFLAGFLGLGKVTDKIMGVIEKVRASVDKALDKGVEWIVDKAKGLVGKAKDVLMWWKKKIGFKTKTGESHNIITEGEPPNVRIAVHSEKTYIEETIKLIKDTAKNKKASDIQKLIFKCMADIEMARKNKKNSEVRALNIELDKNLRALSDVFVDAGVLTNNKQGIGDGSRSNPYAIHWQKPPLSGYESIWLAPLLPGDKPRGRLPKNVIKGLTGSKEYKPTSTKAVPGGGESIGVASMYQPRLGLVVGPKKNGRSDSRKEHFNKLIESHGYDRSEFVTDGDHVIELQVSGPDSMPNLWPLDSKKNQIGGGKLHNYEVSIEDGTKKKVSDLEGKYFKIVKFDA